MKSLLFTAILSLRKRSEQILIKFAILLQVRLTHAQTFFRGVMLIRIMTTGISTYHWLYSPTEIACMHFLECPHSLQLMHGREAATPLILLSSTTETKKQLISNYGQCCGSGGRFKLWGGGGAEPPFYFRKSRIYYVTEEIKSSGDTKYRMYSCPRTTRENVTLVHLRSSISVTISTKIFSFDFKKLQQN